MVLEAGETHAGGVGDPRLLVADKSRQWRERLATRAATAGIDLVGEASTAGECLEVALATHPDVALVDMDLPGGGLMAIARLVARHPRLQVVMTAEQVGNGQLLAALRAGACGIVLKTEPLDRLGWALHGAMAGQLIMPRRLVRVVVEEFTHHGARRRSMANFPGSQRLSSREQQAVSLLLMGKTTAEIAAEMYVSPGSVRAYLSRARTKLRLRDREALRALVRNTGRPGAPAGGGARG